MSALESVLHRARRLGKRAVFLPGNRDFLLKGRALHDMGFELGGDWALVSVGELGGGEKNWLLHHGDLLCSDDKVYLRARRVLRSPPVRALVHLLPLFALQRIAARLRNASRRSVRRRFAEPRPVSANGGGGCVSPERVSEVLAGLDADTCGLVCGHVHAPARIRVGARELITLPAWEHSGGHLLLGPEGARLVERV